MALAIWGTAAAPAFADGQLVVKSQPRGATIYVDGRAVGATPLVVNLPPGDHRVQARLQGYAPQTVVATVVDQLTSQTTLPLERLNRGELRVLARPAGALIYVNGRFAGQAPVFLKGLIPGNHRVVAVREGFVKSVQRIEVVAGLTATSYHTLAAVPAPAPRATARPEPARTAVQPPAPRRQPVVPPAREVRPEAPVKISTAFASPAAEPPVPEAIATPSEPRAVVAEPFVLPELPQLPQLPEGFVLPELPELPALPPISPRELPFLGGMAALLVGLGYYFVRRWLPGAKTRPVLFPPRPSRGWKSAPGPACAPISEAWEAGEVTKARQALWDTIQNGTADAWHYYHLGLIAHREGLLAEAENSYRTALQLDPELVEAGYNLGVLLTDFEQAPQAILAYRKHLEVCPDDVDALFNLGHLYVALGMHQPASVHWTAARRLAPKDPEVRANVVFLLRLMRVQRRTAKRAA